MPSVGWRLRLRNRVDSTGGEAPFYPFADSGSLSFSLERDVTKTISGLTLPPSESYKLTDLSAMELELTLVLDGTSHLMGFYSFTEDTLQKSVVLDEEGTVADLRTVSCGDRLARLIRNNGEAQSLLPGFDPSQVMVGILADVDLPASVAGSVNVAASAITWDGSTTDLAKIKELAELAGHRPPWMTNQGIIKSIQSNTRYNKPLRVEDLQPVAGSIGISSAYLAAPNRVIVSDNGQGGAPFMGQWDAPGAAPHSFVRRGYHRTEIVNIQGLGSSSHAEVVAQTIGERRTARQLDFQCMPTPVLDGPVVLLYDQSEWLVTGWTVGMAPNSLMRVNCEEIFGEAA